MISDEYFQGKEGLARLSSELERQADIYKGLRVPEDAIMRLLAPRPEGLPKELIIPVVTLGTSVDLKNQADFAGIATHNYDLSHGDNIAGGITFSEPHLIWMQDGSKYFGKSVEWVRKHLKRNERPATQYDGVALGIVHPAFLELLQKHGIDLPGTSIEPDYAPYLDNWSGGGPELGYDLVSIASTFSGSATCGG